MGEVSEEVKARTDIVSLIGEYVDLKKVGTTIKGLCPFHQEKTPSFTVNPQKQIFRCFGCGEGGDVFTFVMKREKVEFPRALEILARKAGVEISRGNGAGQRIHHLNAAAVEFYKSNLAKNARILAYLKEKRGLTDASIERFNLGCTNGTFLFDHLKGKGFSEKDLIDGGLARKKDRQLVDYFWKRVMFPISFHGSVKGFGGRVLDASTPKYLNTPASDTFQKKDILYGLDPVGIKEKGYAFVTEGYFDVIMGHQHGHRNTVAPLGTALNQGQLTLLRKYCDRIYPVFDGDAAGERAAIKASQLLFKGKWTGGVILLPQGEDLDSFLRKGGDLEQSRKDSVPFPVYLSRKVPRLRQRILEHLLYRSPIETAEFLAYESSPEERRMTAEMSARRAMGKIFPKTATVVRKDDVEVRIHGTFLGLFSGGGFKFMRDISGDHKQQGTQMLKEYLALKRKYTEGSKKIAAENKKGC